ncbi:hypothetical protein MTR_7g006920 [Medicago truncatula]|uniref:RNase H type-1 domain-containing protein n=1 Tax=Medicago truncatula TaxID=3880 RepID=A0A072TXD5_MEDTR|nr:hypothetical protein MTR_7g006920 [Medicago truncatula]
MVPNELNTTIDQFPPPLAFHDDIQELWVWGASQTGSCGAFGDIGSGGLLRDNKGSWIAGISSNEGQGYALFAELFGVYHGLMLERTRSLEIKMGRKEKHEKQQGAAHHYFGQRAISHIFGEIERWHF